MPIVQKFINILNVYTGDQDFWAAGGWRGSTFGPPAVTLNSSIDKPSFTPAVMLVLSAHRFPLTLLDGVGDYGTPWRKWGCWRNNLEYSTLYPIQGDMMKKPKKPTDDEYII